MFAITINIPIHISSNKSSQNDRKPIKTALKAIERRKKNRVGSSWSWRMETYTPNSGGFINKYE